MAMCVAPDVRDGVVQGEGGGVNLGWRDQGRVPRVDRRCLAEAGSGARTTRIIAASQLDGVLAVADGDHSVLSLLMAKKPNPHLNRT